MLSIRIGKINPSVTLAITTRAKEMKASGIDVISLAAGEPDFDTPEHIKDAAKRALDEGYTKYTPASGTRALKEAICRKFKLDNSLEYKPNQIIVSCGAKHAIFNAVLALCNDADEVIVPAPFWVSYPEMIKASGAEPLVLKTTQDNNFKISPEQLRRAITSKTKLLILNSPSNPTGMVYTQEELQAIAAVIAEHNIFCLSDEIYENIIYDNQRHISIASLGANIKRLTIVINGVSKAYSMTGWRIGYAAAEEEIINAMSNLQSHSTSNPTSISQVAAVAALSGPQDQAMKMVEEFKKRRDYIYERLNSIRGISCPKPQGAFYVLADISAILKEATYKGRQIGNSLFFAEALLEEARVAVIPGVAFGAEGCLRISYANSMKNIVAALDRIEEFINKILP